MLFFSFKNIISAKLKALNFAPYLQEIKFSLQSSVILQIAGSRLYFVFFFQQKIFILLLERLVNFRFLWGVFQEVSSCLHFFFNFIFFTNFSFFLFTQPGFFLQNFPSFLLHSLCESIFAFFSLLFPDLPISSSFSPMFSNWIYSLQSSIILLSCTTCKFRDRSLRSSKSSFFMLVSTLPQNRTKLTSTSELNIALYFAKNWLKYCVKHALESQPKKWHILVTHTWRALTYLQYQDALVKFRWLRLMKPTKC